jgi:hypothetical protein
MKINQGKSQNTDLFEILAQAISTFKKNNYRAPYWGMVKQKCMPTE